MLADVPLQGEDSDGWHAEKGSVRAMLRRGRSVCLLLAALVAVAGCARENDSGGTPTRSLAGTASTATSAAPEGPSDDGPGSAYAAWLSALARQQGAAACRLQAPEFTIDLRHRAILEDRAELGDPCTGFVALLWEDPAFESEIVDIAVTQETDEDALLEVHLAGSAATVRMVYHRAAWLVFSVAPRTEDGAPAAAGAARWVAAWCDLDPAMSRDEIVDLMGDPSGEYTVSDGGEPQLWWAQDQYDFRVYLDVDGSVLELVGDYDALSAADRELLRCPELRS